MSIRNLIVGTSVSAVCCFTPYTVALAQSPDAPDRFATRLDLRKSSIEVPLKRIVSGYPETSYSRQPPAPSYSYTNAAVPDAHKMKVERPLKSVVSQPSLELKYYAPYRAATVNDPPQKPGAFVNPKCKPGKVHWHSTFQEALQASAHSGKPVLLFQMMGNLDDRFC